VVWHVSLKRQIRIVYWLSLENSVKCSDRYILPSS
jgi:hypothetical protein